MAGSEPGRPSALVACGGDGDGAARWTAGTCPAGPRRGLRAPGRTPAGALGRPAAGRAGRGDRPRSAPRCGPGLTPGAADVARAREAGLAPAVPGQGRASDHDRAPGPGPRCRARRGGRGPVVRRGRRGGLRPAADGVDRARAAGRRRAAALPDPLRHRSERHRRCRGRGHTRATSHPRPRHRLGARRPRPWRWWRRGTPAARAGVPGADGVHDRLRAAGPLRHDPCRPVGRGDARRHPAPRRAAAGPGREGERQDHARTARRGPGQRQRPEQGRPAHRDGPAAAEPPPHDRRHDRRHLARPLWPQCCRRSRRRAARRRCPAPRRPTGHPAGPLRPRRRLPRAIYPASGAPPASLSGRCSGPGRPPRRWTGW